MGPATTAFAGAVEVPRILFVKECPYLDLMSETGADVLSLGRVHDLAAARARYPQLSFQGNVDEEVLRSGTVEQVIEATRRCLDEGGGQRHIVNLNHGVDRMTPVENFAAFVRPSCGRIRVIGAYIHPSSRLHCGVCWLKLVTLTRCSHASFRTGR